MGAAHQDVVEPGQDDRPRPQALVRYYDDAGRPLADLIRLDAEPADAIEPGQPAAPVPFAERHDLCYLRAVWDASRCEDMLAPVMLDGQRTGPPPSLADIRARARAAGGLLARGDTPAAQPRDLRGGPVAQAGLREGPPH